MTTDLNVTPFRIQIVLSLLSGKPIKLKSIRSDEDEPGLKDYEVDLLKLIDSITNGTITNINETGTSLYFVPGALTGGAVEHQCKCSRGISYYLQVVICLAPFMKQPIELKLKGVTNDPNDVSIDLMKYSTIPIFKRFIGNDEGLELKIVKRGAKPDGGGEVHFKCPTKMKLIPINLTDPGKIKRIRGVAYAMRVAPAICNRMIDTAKGILLKFLPDVYIISDHQKAINAGNSPGFGLTLVAETINGTFLSAEASSLPRGSFGGRNQPDPSTPEDIAAKAANKLLEEVYRGGCVDSANQYLAFLYMVINQKDVSKILTGILSPFSIQFIKSADDFFKVKFKIENSRNQPVDVNNFKLKQEKEEAELAKKKKRKRNEQMPQEQKMDDVDEEEEAARKKKKMEDETKENNVKEYLNLGHDKLVVSCLGIGYTNLTKTLI